MGKCWPLCIKQIKSLQCKTYKCPIVPFDICSRIISKTAQWGVIALHFVDQNLGSDISALSLSPLDLNSFYWGPHPHPIWSLLPGAQWPFFLSSSSWAHSPGPHKVSFWPLTEFGLKALQTAPSLGIFPGSFPWLIFDFRCQGLRRTFLDHHSQPCPQVTVNIAPFGFLWSPPHFAISEIVNNSWSADFPAWPLIECKVPEIRDLVCLVPAELSAPKKKKRKKMPIGGISYILVRQKESFLSTWALVPGIWPLLLSFSGLPHPLGNRHIFAPAE